MGECNTRKKQAGIHSLPHSPLCAIIGDMKRLAIILALSGLLIAIFGCEAGKSGPFTFTNSTGDTVHVLIDQDGILEKTFTSGEKYQGKDYYSPQITFVKGLSGSDKNVTANRFAATTDNGFDYNFAKAAGTKILITVILPTDFETTVASLKDCYLGEAKGKLSDYSDTSADFKLTALASETSSTGTAASSTSTTSSGAAGTAPTKETLLYTEEPDFRIYQNKTVDGKTEREDLTSLFSLSLGKSEIPPAADTTDAKPTIQWNLVITYPKMEPVN